MIILLYSLIILFPININGAILTDPKRQWSFPIQYNVTIKKYENHIKEAIDEIVNHTCLNFTRNDSLSLNSPGIVFRFNTSVGCSSEKIGPDIDNKTNFINFNDYCISNKVFIQSLIFSALGAYPEQTRLDREKYIYIYYTNIKRGTDLTLFNETNSSTTSDYDTYYDYASVLQFYNLSFSARGGYTMGTTHEYGDVYRKMLGQKSFVTFDNYKLINRHFCNQTCNGTRFGACFSSGYPNPRKCEECLCPYPFEGK
uniref:Metalloendopeptidase n=1 Tax=Parastrongyloides trichosuri TaxID=131310 RepID=A0A0N4Z6A5_PARTI